MEDRKELFIDILRLEKHTIILTLTSKDFFYSEDVSNKSIGDIAEDIQKRILKTKDINVKDKNIILEQCYDVYACVSGEGQGLIDALSSLGVIVNCVNSGNINKKLPKSNNLIEANKIINTRTYENFKEDNKSNSQSLEMAMYDRNFWLQDNSTSYSLAQFSSLKNIIANAIHFKKHILLDGSLIKGMGKSQALADLSAAYQLLVLTFLDKQSKEIKNKDKNSISIALSQWNEDNPMVEKGKIILVDDIPRAEALKLINDGYIVIGFII